MNALIIPFSQERIGSTDEERVRFSAPQQPAVDKETQARRRRNLLANDALIRAKMGPIRAEANDWIEWHLRMPPPRLLFSRLAFETLPNWVWLVEELLERDPIDHCFDPVVPEPLPNVPGRYEVLGYEIQQRLDKRRRWEIILPPALEAQFGRPRMPRARFYACLALGCWRLPAWTEMHHAGCDVWTDDYDSTMPLPRLQHRWEHWLERRGLVYHSEERILLPAAA